MGVNRVTVLVGSGIGVGLGMVVAVGLRVGNLISTGGVGVLGGWGVEVGTRVFVAVGSAGVGVSRLAVGRNDCRVGLGVMVGGSGVTVAVGGTRRSYGNCKSTSIPAQASITNPINTPMISACLRVTIIPFP